MDNLKIGCQYDLISTSASSEGVSVVHVKLTDAALKAFEEFYEWSRNSKAAGENCKSLIQLSGTHGFIKVPLKQSDEHRTFGFVLSATEQKDGCLECIQQSCKPSVNSLTSVGVMTHNLRVQATEDVYQTTIVKMSQVEEESKKARAKEIKQSGPRIGRTVKKLQKPSEAVKIKSDVKQVVNNINICKQYSESTVVKKTPTATTTKELKRSDNFSLRERVIHLLALRAYKKPELILRLQKDGVRTDKTTLHDILEAVAEHRRDTFVLHKHLYSTDVRSDWPFYSDEDRHVLLRKLQQTQELSVTDLPALSPCPSIDSRGSPAPVSAPKRISTTSNSFPVKHARLSDVKPPCTSTPSNINKRRRSSTQSSRVADNLREKLLKNPDYDDYSSEYQAITSASQRMQYKQDFNSQYREYLHLHERTKQRLKAVTELGNSLKLHMQGSLEYESLKQKIYAEYSRLKGDPDYADDRRLWMYLHRKLGHIKHCVYEYDKAQLDCQ